MNNDAEHCGLDSESNSLILGKPHNIPQLLCCVVMPSGIHHCKGREREKSRDKAGEWWVLCIFPPYALAYFDLIAVRAGFLQSVGCGAMLGL